METREGVAAYPAVVTDCCWDSVSISDRDTLGAFSHGAAGFLLKRYPPKRRAMNCPSLLLHRLEAGPGKTKEASLDSAGILVQQHRS